MSSSHKLRAILLSVLMVASITLGTVTLTGTVGAEQAGGVTIQDNSVDAQTNHNWTITPDTGATLVNIELDYSSTGVTQSLSQSDVTVTVAGSEEEITAVEGSDSYLALELGDGSTKPPSVSGGDRITVNTTHGKFSHPATAESNSATLSLQTVNKETNKLETFDSTTDTIEIVDGSSGGESGQGTFKGTVANSSNENPISGATVIAYEDGTDTVAKENTTDENGYYELTLANDTYDLEVTATDYQNKEKGSLDKLKDGDEKIVDFALSPSSSGGEDGVFKGTVTDASTGDGIENVNVAAFTEGAIEPTNSTTTEADGSYRLEVPSDSNGYELSAGKQGYEGGSKSVASLSSGETVTNDFSLSADDSSGGDGRSGDGGDGSPDDDDSFDPSPGDFQLSNAQVYGNPVLEGGELSVGFTVENLASNEGYQTLNLTANGTVVAQTEVYLRAGEKTEWGVTWQTETGDNDSYGVEVESLNDTSKNMSVEVKPGAGAVEGTVKAPDGSALSGADVLVYDDTYEFFEYDFTDQSGSYKVNVPNGEYTVEVRSDKYNTVKKQPTVTDGNTNTTNVKLSEPGVITGYIEKPNGETVGAGVGVVAHDDSWRTYRYNTTNASGGYTLNVPDGSYTVEVQNPPVGTKTSIDDVSATQGQTTGDQNITLQQPAYINGTLYNSTAFTDTAKSGSVTASNGEDYFWSQVDKSTGEFSLEVAPGTYALKAYTRNGYNSSEPKTVEGGDQLENVKLALQNPKIVSKDLQHIGGPKPDMSNISLKGSLYNQFMAIQLSNDSASSGGERGSEAGAGGKPSNLGGLGVKDDTKFKMTFTVSDYKPNTMLWGIRGVNWEVEPNNDCSATNCRDITITGKAVHFEAINSWTDEQNKQHYPRFGPQIGQGSGSLGDQEWPTDKSEDVADVGMNESVFMYMLDIPATGGFASGFSNMTVTTNAQTFTRPKMVNDTLQVYVAAPHETRAGNTHSGFYRAFIPNEQLNEWDVDNPEDELAAKYQGNPAGFEVNSTAGGAWINIDLHYSDGVVQVGDTESVDTTSNEPPDFDVSIESTNGPVTTEETLQVTAEVTNTGGKRANQTVDLKINDGKVDSTDSKLDLSPGEKNTITLTWDPSKTDSGINTVNVTSENDSAEQTVSVTGPANFQVNSLTSNTPVDAGKTLSVDATIQNTGGSKATKTVSLDVGGTERATKDVTLKSGNSQTVTLSWATKSGDGGDYTAKVSVDGSSSSLSVKVKSSGGGGGGGISGPPLPGSGEGSAGDSGSSVATSLSIDSVSDSVQVGDTVDVVVTVSNPGESSVGRTVNLNVGGSTLDSSFVTVAPGGSSTTTLTFTVTESMAASSLSFTVSDSVDQASGTISLSGVEGDTETEDGQESDEGEESEDDAGEESTESADTGSSIPGFGPVAALLALLGWLGIQRRKQ